MTDISLFHKFDNLAAILNILAYFSQTQPKMHVYLNFYVRAHHKNSKKPVMSIPGGTLLHLKPVYNMIWFWAVDINKFKYYVSFIVDV